MRVSILQHRLLHYRVKLFECLKESLAADGISLNLYYGEPSDRERRRNDTGAISWAQKVQNHYFPFAGRDLLWQALPPSIWSSDLVILIQENRIISNYPILLKGRHSRPLVAYWGHGRNMQSAAPTGLRERWKQYWLRRPDWWFAYTSETSSFLESKGFPSNRITVLQNAIDVRSFQSDLESVSELEVADARTKLGIPTTAVAALFCGSLYPEKRLNLLIQSSEIVARSTPKFHLLIIGDGPSAPLVSQATQRYPWIHWLGTKRGREKAVAYRLAAMQLNPGAVGLHVLDAFAAGLPMLTTRTALHGPEIAYLEDGKTGYNLAQDDFEAYAAAILGLINDRPKLNELSKNCISAAKEFTIEKMAQNFHDGIIRALQTSTTGR